MAKPQKPKDIDGYISQFPADVQAILEKVRETIRRAAPDAEEVNQLPDARLQAARDSGLLRSVEEAHRAVPADLRRQGP